MLSIRLRIEYQGNESRQLASLIGRKTETPGSDNRLDYLMMRQRKLNDDDEDEDDSEIGEGSSIDSASFPSAALQHALTHGPAS